MKTILIVDDEPVLLNILQLELEEQSQLEVYTAVSGAQALQIVLYKKIDIILTDLTMPKMDGLNLLKSINEKKIHVPCKMVISGLPKEMYIKKLDGLGVSKYFEKPYSIQEIINFVNSKC